LVPDAGEWEFAVDGQHDGIQIEGQRGARLRHRKEHTPQPVVQGHEVPDVSGRQSFEKPPERGLVGEPGQPQQREERAVVLQDLRLVDPTQTDHDGEEQGEDEVGRPIAAAAQPGGYRIFQQPAET
jgi:hypothetical protein